MRVNSWHHSLAIARGPHPSLHHASFELRGIDEYMRGTGRLLRAGVEKIWGPGRHLAGNNTFSYFLDPSGNTMEYTTELETDRRGHLAPAPLRLHPARGHRPVGHRERDERVRRRSSRSTTRTRACSWPRRSDAAGSPPGEAARHRRRGRRGLGRRRCTRSPPGRPCSTWSAPGCPPRWTPARRRCDGPAVPLERRAAAAAAGRRRRCATSSRSRSTSRASSPASATAAGVVAGVVRGTDVLLHQPVRADRRARRRAGAAGLAAVRLRAARSPRSSAATAPR